MNGIADIAPISLALADTDLPAAAAAFGASFARTGFAVVADHGVDDAVIARADAAMRAVFALPDAAKRAAMVPGGGGARGYTPFGIEIARDAAHHDLKEFWHVGRELPPGHRYAPVMPGNVWPADVADFAPATLALYDALDAAGARILQAIALHLGQPADFFEDAVACGNSVLRLLHYPPVPAGAAGLRAGAHADINVITLLLGADEAGLQLQSRNGDWLDVAAPPGTLVCNIGDMLARLTAGRLPSTRHRVVNPTPERRHLPRYSTPYFLHFRPDYLIEPLWPDRQSPPITANDFLLQRLREIGLL
jgi:isopenicillin N synthase-like dioxygenase